MCMDTQTGTPVRAHTNARTNTHSPKHANTPHTHTHTGTRTRAGTHGRTSRDKPAPTGPGTRGDTRTDSQPTRTHPHEQANPHRDKQAHKPHARANQHTQAHRDTRTNTGASAYTYTQYPTERCWAMRVKSSILPSIGDAGSSAL